MGPSSGQGSKRPRGSPLPKPIKTLTRGGWKWRCRSRHRSSTPDMSEEGNLSDDAHVRACSEHLDIDLEAKAELVSGPWTRGPTRRPRRDHAGGCHAGPQHRKGNDAGRSTTSETEPRQTVLGPGINPTRLQGRGQPNPIPRHAWEGRLRGRPWETAPGDATQHVGTLCQCTNPRCFGRTASLAKAQLASRQGGRSWTRRASGAGLGELRMQGGLTNPRHSAKGELPPRVSQLQAAI